MVVWGRESALAQSTASSHPPIHLPRDEARCSSPWRDSKCSSLPPAARGWRPCCGGCYRTSVTHQCTCTRKRPPSSSTNDSNPPPPINTQPDTATYTQRAQTDGLTRWATVWNSGMLSTKYAAATAAGVRWSTGTRGEKKPCLGLDGMRAREGGGCGLDLVDGQRRERGGGGGGTWWDGQAACVCVDAGMGQSAASSVVYRELSWEREGKRTWIWPEWRSTETMRSTPTSCGCCLFGGVVELRVSD